MRQVRAVVLEALLVAVVGLGFGLLANAVSPYGLRLKRDYFPAPRQKVSAPGGAGPVLANVTNGAALTVQRLQQRGLQIASSNEVVELFRDPRYQQGIVVFIDARDDAHYGAGHIPGAWQFNHYRAEEFLPTVLPVALNAEKVVVYCRGAACEDSEFAAVMLRDGGVAAENLFVYAGGITEWVANKLPVEIGQRGSGQLAEPK